MDFLPELAEQLGGDGKKAETQHEMTYAGFEAERETLKYRCRGLTQTFA